MRNIPEKMEIDPKDYDSLREFKRAVYEEYGAGSWMDDILLKIYYHRTHDLELPDYIEKYIKTDVDRRVQKVKAP